MEWNNIAKPYEQERKQKPESLNQLLDYYQGKYIASEIDIKQYRNVYYYLQAKGATSAHEYL